MLLITPSPEHRQKLYFDQYQYCISFVHRKISVIRGLTQKQCQRNIEFRQRWEQSHAPSSRRGPIPTVFTAETQQSLLGLCTLLADHKANHGCKLVLGEDWAYVYTNNLELLSKFQAWPLVCRIEVREALCTIPRDVILQNQPEFRYRVYFRERLVSDDEKQRLRNWLNHQPQDQVRGSPTLRRWLPVVSAKWNRNLCQRYYYVDFQDQASITMLGLVTSGLIRNTCTIKARQ